MRRVLTAVGCAALMFPLLPATASSQEMEEGDLGMVMTVDVEPAHREAYVEALEMMEAIDPEHTRVASALSSLGRLYMTQGRYQQADSVLRRSLRKKNSTSTASRPPPTAVLRTSSMLDSMKRERSEATSTMAPYCSSMRGLTLESSLARTASATEAWPEIMITGVARQRDRQQRERRKLCCKCLGRGHANLGAGARH